MEFLKMNKLRKALKPEKEVKKEIENEELGKSDEDDDDFIMNEVKRRLKELRNKSFMVLIPEEEACAVEEEEDEEEVEANEWRDVEEEGRRLWSCFGAFYDKYCDRMLLFDRQLLKQISSLGSEDDLETSYVSQLCLTWEALHCQYTQLTTAETSRSYNHSAQQFQQFQVLLQRFIENEPFQPGLRPQIYAHSRNAFPKLLQVPNIEESGQELTKEESMDLIRIIESSILTFHVFVKMDKKKKKKNGVRNLFGGQCLNQMATPLHQVQSSLDKRKVKLKELWKKRKGGKKNNEWPATQEEVELLLGLIDVKVMARVLRMVKITKEQLFWIEEKMKKLHLSGKLQRDPSPVLFPC